MDCGEIVVIGEGWAALSVVGLLVTSGVPVKWISGTGDRIIAPMDCIGPSSAVSIIAALALKLGIFCGEPEQGSFVKEFRNKRFREVFSQSHLFFEGALQTRFQKMTLCEIEEAFRKALNQEDYPHLTKMEGAFIEEFRMKSETQVESLLLDMGGEIRCSSVIYGDRWSELSSLKGLPQGLLQKLSFLRGAQLMDLFQVSFDHKTPIGEGVRESFFSPFLKDSTGLKVAESQENQAVPGQYFYGYFSSDGMRSHWTFYLTADEEQRNHEMAKKFKKMKTLLDQIFTGSHFLPHGQENFFSTVVGEQIRVTQDWIFLRDNHFIFKKMNAKKTGIHFLTDAYGMATVCEQAARILDLSF